MSQQSNPFAHFTGLYRPPTPQQQPQPGTGIDLLNFMRPVQPQPMVIPSDMYQGATPTRLPTTPKSAAASAKTLQLINDLKQYNDQSSKSSG
jgi:hypothetical protein